MKILVEEFRSTEKNLLHKGCERIWNTLIIRPANCGKAFLLKSLGVVYRSFVNTATSNFAWVGTEKAELLFLTTFVGARPQVIPWHDLLLLLESEPLDLPTPKTHYNQDILLTRNTPIFGTSSSSYSSLNIVSYVTLKLR